MSQLTNTKAAHPADGSPRWIVTGDAGQVVYDVLGNHLALLAADGEIDSMGKRWADEVLAYAEDDDDQAVFRMLGRRYRTELVERGAR